VIHLANFHGYRCGTSSRAGPPWSGSSGSPRQLIPNLDHRVTHWMSPFQSVGGALVSCTQLSAGHLIADLAEITMKRGTEMASMRVMQVGDAGADFELVEREVPAPGFREALVRVHACGVCHSDPFAKNGGYPGVSHPLEIPGITVDGRYADYVVVRASVMASMPDDLSAEDAAPLLCGGITTYNALRIEVYEKMMSGDARFRMVITTSA